MGRRPQGRASEELRAESAAAGRNAGMLGAAIFLTAGVGLAIELVLNATLGPERYGRVAFARSLAEIALVLSSFGLDVYARKEVAVRPEHASEFVGGFLVARAVLTTLAVVIIGGLLTITGKSSETVVLAALFGTAQFFIHSEKTIASVLQAVGVVKQPAFISIGTKLLWAAIIGIGLVAHVGLAVIPLAWITTEAANLLAFIVLAKRRMNLRLRVRHQLVGTVAKACAPFLVLQLTGVLFFNLDVTLVGFLTNDQEVGLYRTAMNLAMPVLILAPVIQQVLTPLAARAHHRSAHELAIVTRRSMELAVGLAIPVAVLLALNAETFLALPFLDHSAAAAPSLRLLALTVISTYANMVVGTYLTITGQSWFLTRVVIAGVILDGLLNLYLIPHGLRWWGAGGAGIGAAISFLTAETVVAALMIAKVARVAFDARNVRVIVSVALMGLLVVVFDHLLRPTLGLWRILADTGVYGVHLAAIRVVDPRAVRQWLHQRRVRRLAHLGGASRAEGFEEGNV